MFMVSMLTLNFPERPVLGIWMTLGGKFIQKEGAQKVTINIIVFPDDIFLSMAMIPFQYEKMDNVDNVQVDNVDRWQFESCIFSS